jgi:hypothetical protein
MDAIHQHYAGRQVASWIATAALAQCVIHSFTCAPPTHGGAASSRAGLPMVEPNAKTEPPPHSVLFQRVPSQMDDARGGGGGGGH